MAVVSAARTVWQRMANRCSVQEDAKRAPKVAFCSSSSPAIPQSRRDSSNVPHQFMPVSVENLPPISTWWLQRKTLEHGSEGNAAEHELNFVIAKMSLDNIHNSNLAELPDVKTKSSWYQFSPLEKFGQEDSRLDGAVHFPQGSVYGTYQLLQGVEKLNSYSPQSSGSTNYEIATGEDQYNRINSRDELSKAQLLEALLHSQTRARKAEKAAQQACHEKDQILKLFFRQASQLFVSKQLLQLLQFETLHLRLKSQDSGQYFLFSLNVDASEDKAIKSETRRMQRDRCWQKDDSFMHATAFAVGLSLAGAGLLFGWTIGLWLSTF